METECEFCNKVFKTKGNLFKHQKTTKYCIKIQKEQSAQTITYTSYNCLYCKKEFSQSYNLERHIPTCNTRFNSVIEEKEATIKEKEATIKELEEKMNKIEQKNIRLTIENELLREQSKESQSTINEIAKQPRVATTNNHNKIMITTPVDLSQPTVQLAIQNGFSDEYLVQGQKGVARFAVENILKDEQGKLKYICTDAARQIFQYKNEDGTISKDVRATKLTKALLEAEIKQTSHKIAWDKMEGAGDEAFMAYTNYYQNIQDMEQDNSEFSKELSCLTI
jgi:hypothetical protein